MRQEYPNFCVGASSATGRIACKSVGIRAPGFRRVVGEGPFATRPSFPLSHFWLNQRSGIRCCCVAVATVALAAVQFGEERRHSHCGLYLNEVCWGIFHSARCALPFRSWVRRSFTSSSACHAARNPPSPCSSRRWAWVGHRLVREGFSQVPVGVSR